MKKQELLSLALVRVRNGELPDCEASQLYAGSGHEQECALCEQPITRAQVEYEVALSRNVEYTARGSIYFHLACHEAWVKACGECGSAEVDSPTRR